MLKRTTFISCGSHQIRFSFCALPFQYLSHFYQLKFVEHASIHSRFCLIHSFIVPFNQMMRTHKVKNSNGTFLVWSVLSSRLRLYLYIDFFSRIHLNPTSSFVHQFVRLMVTHERI